MKERDFDSRAAQWDQEERRVKLARDVAEGIIRAAGPLSHMRVLDFGCGTGLLTLFLQPHVLKIDGIDTSRGMLEVLETKVRERQITNVRWQQGDLLHGDRPAGPYDLIATSMTLHHIRDIRPVIGIFYELLAPRGMVCIADLDKEEGTYHDDPTGIEHNGFERGVIQAALEEPGFAEISDVTIATIRKGTPGAEREYPVFLIAARKMR